MHQHLELSAQEFQTKAWLMAQLADSGFDLVEVGETGLAAVLANGTGPVAAFRADVDALPALEETGVAWASTAPDCKLV